jgi:dTDP-4-dehydrorhamnose 3,5-epimerase
MRFKTTPLADACIIDIEKHVDQRGFFARTWCRNEFTAHGLSTDQAQFSISFNWRKGTLRGMHFQIPPNEETKIVRCTSGAIYDVIVDLRRSSSSYLQHFGIELNAENRTMLYVPRGFAHGFITLEDNTEVSYLISEFYAPGTARGVRWDDPVFGIVWPIEPVVMSEADRTLPDFDESILT